MNILVASMTNVARWIAGVSTPLALLASCSANYSQEFAGFNGPPIAGAHLFNTEAEVEHSWVRRALSPDDYRALISKVDFRHRRLVALAAGEWTSITQAMEITHVKSSHPTLNVTALIRVAAKECGQRGTKSYPFVIASLDQSGGEVPTERGFDIANAPGACTVEMSASSTGS